MNTNKCSLLLRQGARTLVLLYDRKYSKKKFYPPSIKNFKRFTIEQLFRFKRLVVAQYCTFKLVDGNRCNGAVRDNEEKYPLK